MKRHSGRARFTPKWHSERPRNQLSQRFCRASQFCANRHPGDEDDDVLFRANSSSWHSQLHTKQFTSTRKCVLLLDLSDKKLITWLTGAKRPDAKLRNGLDEMLEAWRSVLPAHLKWNDEDDPADNINDARLRAKFYGAQYIIHRPFLRLILDNEVTDRSAMSPPKTTFTPLNERRTGPMGPPNLDLDQDIPADIQRSAEICVKAAMNSTTAFDKIIERQRLVVTNVFGTAHAYV